MLKFVSFLFHDRTCNWLVGGDPGRGPGKGHSFGCGALSGRGTPMTAAIVIDLKLKEN